MMASVFLKKTKHVFSPKALPAVMVGKVIAMQLALVYT
jgi:hypothetical protein